MERTGAEIIVRLLERQGVRLVAGIPGGANLPLYDALADSSIRHVLARHEQGAGFIAQGAARAGTGAGVCLATSGPGMTNTLTALADALADSVPLVAITGQVARGLIGTEAFQEVDACALARPVCKAVFQPRSAAELLAVVPAAFAAALSDRPGPVLVDVPRDVQTETAAFARWPEPGAARSAPAPAPEALEEAARRINSARRPMLLVGGGAARSGAAGAARRIAAACGFAAGATLMGLGVFGRETPGYLGMIGMHGAPCANLALAECDLLLAVGLRFDDRATGRLDAFCPGAEVVHLDIEARQLGRLRAADVAVHADAARGLGELEKLLRPRERATWRARLAELAATRPLVLAGATDPRTPCGLLLAAAKLAGEDVLVATDVGQHQMTTAQTWPFAAPGTFLTSGGQGTMGFGLPAAIGASLARPGKRVVLVTGDGSLLMNLQELATAAETGANVTIVVMDNGRLGLVAQQQDLFMGARRFASDFAARPDFAALARGFGLPGIDLAGERDPVAALAGALATPGTSLVRAPVEAADAVWPMVPPGAANTEMIERAPAACA